MVEPRGRKYHRDRVAETLREEISAMIAGELRDPRIAFAHVSEVVINAGGKSAQVYIAVDGGEVEEEKTLAALTAARALSGMNCSRGRVSGTFRTSPFTSTKSMDLKMRIDELLGRSKKGQQAVAGAKSARGLAAKKARDPHSFWSKHHANHRTD